MTAVGVRVGPSSQSYRERIAADLAPMLAPGWVYPDHLRKGIRSLLKAYGFHPSGRNRPASEYLAKDLADRREFKPINNVVDINNHVSLCSHLPISVLDLDKTGDRLGIRVGLAGESYVFNQEGQMHDLKQLLVVTRENGHSEPVGSPVKDSHATKVFAETRRVLAVLYASQTVNAREEVETWAGRFAELLRTEAGAEAVDHWVVDASNG